MGALKPVAFVLAGIALLAAIGAGLLAFLEPSSDCGGDRTEFYCLQDAYEARAGWVLLLGILAVACMVAAVGCYGIHVVEARRAESRPASKAGLRPAAAGNVDARFARRDEASSHPGEDLDD